MDYRSRGFDNAVQGPAASEVDRVLHAACPDVGGGNETGFVEEHNGVVALLEAQRDADLGCEGGEDDDTSTSELIDGGEDAVEKGVELDGPCVHLPFGGFP